MNDYFWTAANTKGNKAYIRGYRLGKRFTETVNLKPYLFEEAPNGDYKTLEGRPARKIEFDDVNKAWDYIKQTRELSNKTYYGLQHFLYTHLNDEFYGKVEYDPNTIARCSVDIETMSDGEFPKPETALKEITAITYTHRRNGKRRIAMFGCKPYTVTHPEVTYFLCKDEKHLLKSFIGLWSSDEWSPDVLTGWYTDGFDIPYIINRVRNQLGDKWVNYLSPFGIVKEREIARGQTVGASTSRQMVYEIFGVSCLDYLELYKKFSFKNQASYKLDHIAEVELGEKKLDYSQWGSLHEFYLGDYQGYMDYNLQDTLLVDRLDEEKGYINLVLAFAYDAKVTYNDTMTTTRPWDVIIHNYLMERRIVVPQSLQSPSYGAVIGGYVKQPEIGLYDGVVSFDFDSLYPHLIMGWNISPETFIEKIEFDAIASLERGTFEADVEAFKPMLEEKNAILAGNGCLYRKDIKGFLPSLMEQMYADRAFYKNKMKEAKQAYQDTKDPKYLTEMSLYDGLQLAKKIQLNSAYGALANDYYRWFAHHLAESVTYSGQMSTRWTEIKINNYMNTVLGTTDKDYVIASDTDSIYMNLAPLVDSCGMRDKPIPEMIEFLDSACKARILKQIKKECENLTSLVGCETNKLNMKRENIANKGIWTAKKKYILNVWDSEGTRYKEPEIKVVGIESVRSSTPAICRDAIKKAMKIVLDGNERELQHFIADFKEGFLGQEFHNVASPRGINGMDKYKSSSTIYSKGTPAQVRGALLFNHYVKTMGLQDKYPLIHDGMKIKFCYLKMPNPIRENIISVPEILPPEFDLHEFIDHELQYEKVFVSPIMKITEAIGWQTEKHASLMDFLL